MKIYKRAERILFNYEEGPRNQPAAKWATEFGGLLLGNNFIFEKIAFDQFTPVSGVNIKYM
jgi:hypothetical protein